MTVLKVMLPYASYVPNPKLLVFDHTRTIFGELEITPAHIKMMGIEHILYIEGELLPEDQGGLRVDKVLNLNEEERMAFDKVGFTPKEAPNFYDSRTEKIPPK